MPTPPLSDALAQQAADAYLAHDRNANAAARSLGINGGTFDNRLKKAAQRGMLGTKPVLPGFRLSKTTTVTDKDGDVVREFVQQKPEPGPERDIPAGHIVKGVSVLRDGDGNTIQEWVKTRLGEFDPLALADALKESFRDYQPAAPVTPEPGATDSDLLTLVPCADWHLGMFAWHKETGTNWDLKIAQDLIGRKVEEVIAASPASGECVILGGGDLLHADNKENRTMKSGHALDVDGRHQKVLLAAGHLMVRTGEAALRHHKHVTFRILPGNHDEQSAVAIAYFLHAWFRNEPRVTVDIDPSLFWWMRFGKVMLGATHGHTVKLAKMPGIMAARRPADWGASRVRYIHGFHIHHTSKLSDEEGGCLCESHQSPIPQDAWHVGAGFLSGRSQKAITYHREWGEEGRVTRNIFSNVR